LDVNQAFPLYDPNWQSQTSRGAVSQLFEIGPVQVGTGRVFLIDGPCVIKSGAHVRTMAEPILLDSNRPETNRCGGRLGAVACDQL